MTGKTNILFAFDNNISKYVPPLMISFFKNNPNRTFQFFMMHPEDSNLGKDTQHIINAAESNGAMVTFLPVKLSDLANIKERVSIQGNYTISTWLRLFVTDYLPLDVDRILYIDVDFVVSGDISTLYDIDFQDKLLAGYGASPEVAREYNSLPPRYITEEESLTYKGIFGAGMLMYNMDKWREDKIDRDKINEFVNIHLNNNFKRSISDWVVLNNFFRYQTVLLDNDNDDFKGYNENIFVTYKMKNKNQKLVHFVFNNKPWNYLWTKQFLESYPFLKTNWAFNPMRVTDMSLTFFNKWWEYAKEVTNYSELYAEASIRTKNIDRLLRDSYSKMYAHQKAVSEQTVEDARSNFPIRYLTSGSKWRVIEDDVRHAKFELYSYSSSLHGRLIFPISLKKSGKVKLRIKISADRPSNDVGLYWGSGKNNFVGKIKTISTSNDIIKEYEIETTFDKNKYEYIFISGWDNSINAKLKTWILVEDLSVENIE